GRALVEAGESQVGLGEMPLDLGHLGQPRRLARTRRPERSGNPDPLAQPVALNQRGTDVNVVRGNLVIPRRIAEKAVPFRVQFQHPAAGSLVHAHGGSQTKMERMLAANGGSQEALRGRRSFDSGSIPLEDRSAFVRM